MRSWIKLLQSDMQTAVLNNGFTSEWFNISRSLRQGDPISSFLFIILVKLLGIKLRANTVIQRTSNQEHAKFHAQLADDLWAAIRYHLESLNESLNVVNDFASFSGLKINFAKTH